VGLRRKGRELALQLLFAQDRSIRDHLDPITRDAFWEAAEAPEEARHFAEALVAQVAQHKDELDITIRRCAENWTLDRMSRVDRNLLRLAVCELLYGDDVPVRVTLDEAVEIAKRYGGDDSSRFVNGVLDRVARELPDSVAAKDVPTGAAPEKRAPEKSRISSENSPGKADGDTADATDKKSAKKTVRKKNTKKSTPGAPVRLVKGKKSGGGTGQTPPPAA